jgi:helicase SWR1
LEKAIEMGTMLEDENLQRVSKLHTVLRPYLLRRLKADVEKELPSKYEHLVLCPLSRRQRFLYDEFMSRAATRDALQSGNYQKIANILMQLRKVCNHPDLFEVRPIVTSFAMQRSVIATFSLTESLTRRLFATKPALNSDLHDLRFIERQNTSLVASLERRRLDASSLPPSFADASGSCAWDVRTITGFRAYFAHQTRLKTIARWSHFASINRHRCNQSPIYSHEIISIVSQFSAPLSPLSTLERGNPFVNTLVPLIVTSFAKRAQQLGSIIDKFTFVTPTVVALDLPRITFSGVEDLVHRAASDPSFDEVLRPVIIKRQIAFPEPSLLQYDCGKLQKLATLLREKKAGGHRVLIFTQMTRILDILEIFLDSHGYLYLRLDGATKIEDRQYITERFNVDVRVFCFIASSRSGGVGIK